MWKRRCVCDTTSTEKVMPAEPVDPAIIYGNIGRCPACRHPIRFGSRRDPIEIAQALRRLASVYDRAARKNSPSRTEAAGPKREIELLPPTSRLAQKLAQQPGDRGHVADLLRVVQRGLNVDDQGRHAPPRTASRPAPVWPTPDPCGSRRRSPGPRPTPTSGPGLPARLHVGPDPGERAGHGSSRSPAFTAKVAQPTPRLSHKR